MSSHLLLLLSVQEHVVVGRNDKTDVAEEAITSTVNKLKNILNGKDHKDEHSVPDQCTHALYCVGIYIALLAVEAKQNRFQCISVPKKGKT